MQLIPMKRILQQLVSLKAIAIRQISAASLSLLASSAMAIMIFRTEKRLTKPYRRIIFGVSLADIAFSFSLVTAPFFVPNSTPNSWGMGNEGTCQMIGFTLLFSVNIVPMYTCFLCWYYLCKLKYHMTNEAFTRKYEWKGHIFITSFCLMLALSALCLNTIHPTVYKTTCQLAVTPLGCRFYPNLVGECDPTIETRVNITSMVNSGLRILWLITMIAIMIMLYQHVIFTNRVFQPSAVLTAEGGELSQENVLREEDTNDIETVETSSQVLQLQLARKLATLYRNETALQGTCYVAGYCLTYMPTVITNYLTVMQDGSPPTFFAKIAFVLNPLGGVFIILVYTRPQAAHLRRVNPELSRLKAFWLILKAGGELPEEPSDAINRHDQNYGLGRRGRLERLRVRQYLQPMGGMEDSISSVQFGVESMSSSTPDAYSTIGIPNDSSTVGEEKNTGFSLQEGDLKYNPKSQWSHVEGGSINS